ncbi:MAG: SUMF1/EgtB/PvdO family nonheme iron enzyme [Cyanobacteriota/Melainabacteria group bacterium]
MEAGMSIGRPASFSVLVLAIALVLGSASTQPGFASVSEDMILIKGGVFTMGGVGPRARGDELPPHKVEVKSFYLDRHEVTNEEFGRFVETAATKPQQKSD